MATDKKTLKMWFKNKQKPDEKQFWAWMDAYFHKDEKISIESIENIQNILAGKADTASLNNLVSLLEGKADAAALDTLKAIVDALNKANFLTDAVVDVDYNTDTEELEIEFVNEGKKSLYFPKSNNIAGVSADYESKKIEIILENDSRYEIDMKYFFQDVVRSTFGYAEVFPENPNVGEFFYLKDNQTDKVLKVWQFNGEEWDLIKNHMYNYQITYSDKNYYNNYGSSEDRFKSNISGIGNGVELLNFSTDADTNTVRAQIQQDFEKYKNTSVTISNYISYVVDNKSYYYGLNINEANTTFTESNFEFTNQNYVTTLDLITTSNTVRNISIHDNQLLSSFSVTRNLTLDAFESINVVNNGTDNMGFVLTGNSKSVIIKNNATLSSFFYMAIANADSTRFQPDIIDLSEQSITSYIRFTNLDFTNCGISYPILQKTNNIYIQNCTFSQEKFDEFYNFLLNSPVACSITYYTNSISFSADQLTALKNKGFTVKQK